MAAIFRFGICRLVNGNSSNKLLSNTSDLKVSLRTISGRTLRNRLPPPKKPAPWPYKTKSYTMLNAVFDKTSKRFDENTKLIVVEGPLAAGKTKFAKELADELEMLYLPEANLDMLYTNEYGYNLKKLDDQVPESCRSFDIKDFLINPRHRLVGSFQLQQLSVKYSQYIDALAHLFSTGQGVVLDRCVYSDFVFVEAMYKQGFLSKEVRSVYYDVRKNILNELLRPHLIVYLDVPVDKVLQKINQRNISFETRSTAITPQYLQAMENAYKQNYLKEMSIHGELLVYDWSEEGEVEVVVEDIERFDFQIEYHEKKFADWNYNDKEEELAVMRYTYSDRKDELLMNLNVPRLDAPELITEAEDARIYRDMIENAPGMTYMEGYNPTMGDTGLLFKTGLNHRVNLPVIERRLE